MYKFKHTFVSEFINQIVNEADSKKNTIPIFRLKVIGTGKHPNTKEDTIILKIFNSKFHVVSIDEINVLVNAILAESKNDMPVNFTELVVKSSPVMDSIIKVLKKVSKSDTLLTKIDDECSCMYFLVPLVSKSYEFNEPEIKYINSFKQF